MLVHSERQAQIKAQNGIPVRTLIFDKTLTIVLAEYSNYSNVFSIEYAAELPKYTRMNYHAIELEESK